MRLDGTAPRPQRALQILVHILVDDRLGAQSAVSFLLQARRQTGEILYFELTRIGRVLQLQCGDCAIDRAEALVEQFGHCRPRTSAEYFFDLIAIERDHVLQDVTSRQLDLEPVTEEPRQRPCDADPMMDGAGHPHGPVEGKNAGRRLLVAGDPVAVRSVTNSRGMSEKVGRHPPRHGPALEIIETEFLLAIGQNVERCPLPQLGGEFGVLDRGSSRFPAIAVIDFCYFGYNLWRDLMLASYGFYFLRNRRKGKPDDPLADCDFRRSQAADFEQAHQWPHCRRGHQQREQHKTGRENADELTNLGEQRGVLGCCERQGERDRSAHPSP